MTSNLNKIKHLITPLLLAGAIGTACVAVQTGTAQAAPQKTAPVMVAHTAGLLPSLSDFWHNPLNFIAKLVTLPPRILGKVVYKNGKYYSSKAGVLMKKGNKWVVKGGSSRAWRTALGCHKNVSWDKCLFQGK